jgi:hypothetical protein
MGRLGGDSPAAEDTECDIVLSIDLNDKTSAAAMHRADLLLSVAAGAAAAAAVGLLL